MSRSMPDPRSARRFHFGARIYDAAAGAAQLRYRFDDGPDLVEQIIFPYSPWPSDASRQQAFEQSLRLLHLVAGVSYYKAGVCTEISFEEDGPDCELASFLTDLYVRGLAEFAYVNRLDLISRVRFVPDSGQAPKPGSLLMPDRALVAMGGGKDSLVGLRLIQRAEIEVQPVCVGNSPLIQDTVEAAGLPLLQIERNLAPELSAMNEAGAWNGHVPVTAINSAILLCAALLYGYRYVVFSNERSADEPTLSAADGSPVNHQYSKSSYFERDLSAIVSSHISPDLKYFSVLRPFSELGILHQFSRMTEFHPIFSSCNRHFHVDGPRIEQRWCLDCPKCRFAALGLAVFLSPAEVAAIQGAILLDRADQLEGYRALCGLGRDKPFECVGEAGESRAALAALERRDQWRDHVVVRALAPELRNFHVPPLTELLQPSDRHFLPTAVTARLQDLGLTHDEL